MPVSDPNTGLIERNEETPVILAADGIAEPAPRLRIRTSVLVSLTLFTGGLLELVKNSAIAYRYGSGADTDALFAAYLIPATYASFWASSCLVGMVPLLSMRMREDRKRLPDLAGSILLVSAISTIALACIGYMVAPGLVHALVPGFDSVYQHKAVFLFRLLTPLFVFVGLAGVATAILNSQHKFFLAASQKVIVNVIVLYGLFAWSSSTGIEWLAKLIVAGTAVYAVALLGDLFMSEVRPRFCRVPKWELQAILAAILLPFSALTIRQASVLFERAIASFLPSGSISALTYNFQVVGGFSTVISAGLVTVLLPRLAQQNAGHERLALMRQGFYYLLVILLPLAMGAFLLSRSFVSILFFHGAFSAASADLATRVFRMYAFSMLFPEMAALLQVPFWADQRYRLLIAHNGMMAGVNVVLDLLLVRMIGVPGLALGFTLTGLVSGGRMAWLLHRDYGLLWTKERLSDLCKPLAATLVMLAVILAVQKPFSAFVFYRTSPFRGEIVRTAALVILGFITYAVAGISTRMEPFPALFLTLRTYRQTLKREG